MVDTLIIGILVGTSYALVGVGLTVIYGVLGVVNFAHGEILTFGALVGVAIFRATNGDLLMTVVGVLAIGWIAGAVMHAGVLRRVASVDPAATIVATLALAMVLSNLAILVVGRWNEGQPLLYRTSSGSPVTLLAMALPQTITIAGGSYSPLRIAAGGIAVFAVAVITVVLRMTQLGRALRAVAWNPDIAATFGIDPPRVARIAVAASVALTCLAGVFVGATVSVSPALGTQLALKAFAVVVCAGFGNVGSTLIVGLLIGVTESVTARYMTSADQYLWLYGLLIVLLLLRPRGLRPEQSVRAL